MELFFSFGRK